MTFLRAAAAALAVMMATPAFAQMTRKEALAAVYPGASVRAEQVFLTPSQQKAVLTAADADVSTALVARYIATRDGRAVGRQSRSE